ncbi:uncharacterized protein LOC142506063 [Primulina tabacum]|uniref:uncharacterized protein LOC142506063 n=1 Tax=Primulina tabacum TaxID=48773 RepID=UPI003F5AB91C
MSREGVEIAPGSGSAPNSAPNSPKNRIKFLCSHGGKILPRPADRHLKYVGGETRVISVPRDIPFQELVKKLTYLIEGEMILKYQVLSEDLDSLVSVRSDEDLRHMMDEAINYEAAGAPKLRAFLFPANPFSLENQMGYVDPHELEQRYIDAINGMIPSTPFSMKQHPTINSVQHGSLVSSACSSPRSPDSCTTETINNEAVIHGNHQSSRTNMHKVHSMPSICSLNSPQQTSYYVHQIPHQYYQNYRQPHYPAHQSPKPPIDFNRSVGPERLMSVRSVGRVEGVNYQVDPVPHNYYSPSRQNVVMNPVVLSPRHGHSGMKAWDNAMGGDT